MHLEELALRPEPRWGDLSFLSVDPLIRPYDPQSHNAYSYARNNPIALIDPSGMSAGGIVDPAALEALEQQILAEIQAEIDAERASEPDPSGFPPEGPPQFGNHPWGSGGQVPPSPGLTPVGVTAVSGVQVAAVPAAVAACVASQGCTAAATVGVVATGTAISHGINVLMEQIGGEGAEDGRGADGQTDAQRDTDQETDIEAAQDAKRKVGRGEEIRDISKSRQRAKARRDRIGSLEDALDDFGDD